MSHTKYALGAVAVVLFAASQASAVTLQDLLDTNGTITNNGVIFKDFAYGGALPASGVTITSTTQACSSRPTGTRSLRATIPP